MGLKLLLPSLRSKQGQINNAINMSLSTLGQMGAQQNLYSMIDQSGEASRQRIGRQFTEASAGVPGLLSARGLGTSMLINNGQMGVERDRQQALLDLESNLLQQKIGVGENALNRDNQRTLTSMQGSNQLAAIGAQKAGMIQNTGPLNQNYYGRTLADQLLQAHKYNQFMGQSNAGILAKPQMNIF